MPGEMTSDFAQLLQEAKLDLVRRRVLFEGANEHEHFLLSEVDRLKAERDEIEAKSHLKLMAFRSIEKVEQERDEARAQVAQLRKELGRAELWLMERHPDHQQEGLSIIQAALAATEPKP